MSLAIPAHVYEATPELIEVRSRKDTSGVDLIFDALPFGGLWYVSNAIGYAEFRSRSHDAML